MSSAARKSSQISLPAVVGGGYGSFWRSRDRYRVVKGSRRSKKSKTAALDLIVKMMEHPQANLLVVRKTLSSVKDSCFTELKWAINVLRVEAWWHITENPLQMTYKPTGQKIYFRGLDDPLKITSITVETGTLCWLWVEEAYEIDKESDFDVIDESILGALPEGLYRQTTLTLNPWHEKCWIKPRFFDISDAEAQEQSIFRMTTTYLQNEWLDASARRFFEQMKTRNPRRYQVAALGNWGVTEGLVYENFHEQKFSFEDIARPDKEGKPTVRLETVCGLDFGYTNHPSAFYIGWLDKKEGKLYIWDEIYKTGLSAKAINNEIITKGYGKERIIADCAEPRTIDELKSYGLRVRGCKKPKGFKISGIQWLQGLEIVIHPRCENFINEISCYTWRVDRAGQSLNEPVDKDDHLMDGLLYSVEDHIPSGRGWLI